MPIPLIAAGIGAVGSVAGSAIKSGAQGKANDARQAALEAITQAINLPSVEEQKVALQGLVSSGQITPEMLESVNLGDSAMEDISSDPRLKSAQMSALEKLTQQGQEGLTAQDRLGLNQIGKESERAAQARNASILQNMQQRGMGGSGAELAAQLAGSQAATESAQNQGMNIASQAQQRALEATMSGANLAGSIDAQDFNKGAQVASAKDAISKFNAANQQNVAGTNVAAKNSAQAANLANAQSIANSNVATKNQQEIANKGLIQQNFNNQVQKGQLASNAYNGVANAAQNQANATQDLWTGIGKAGAQGVAALGSSTAADEAKKKLLGMAGGGEVAGKAKHSGDHPENDTVPALLSPGEVIIPRSVLDEADKVILNFIKKSRK